MQTWQLLKKFLLVQIFGVWIFGVVTIYQPNLEEIQYQGSEAMAAKTLL